MKNVHALFFLSSILNHCNYSLRMLFKKQNHRYFSQLQNPKTALELSEKLNRKIAFQLRTVKIEQKPISWATWQKTGVLWM